MKQQLVIICIPEDADLGLIDAVQRQPAQEQELKMLTDPVMSQIMDVILLREEE